MPRVLLALLALYLAATVHAADAPLTAAEPELEAKMLSISSELRCLVCQNESLAASQADLAQDLRMEVYGMMREGKGNDEIVEFLVARYGDFVLYEPPIKPSTYLLWFGPFVLIALGGFLLLRALKRKKTEPEQDLNAAERARIDQFLASQGAGHSDRKDPAQ
jgi:cytochrome c-type biogenesis protein CcmH